MATGGAALSTTAKPTTTTSWRSKRATSSSSSTRRPRTRTGWRDTYWVTPPSADYFQCLSSTCSQIDQVFFNFFFEFPALHSRRRRRLLSFSKVSKVNPVPYKPQELSNHSQLSAFFSGKVFGTVPSDIWLSLSPFLVPLSTRNLALIVTRPRFHLDKLVNQEDQILASQKRPKIYLQAVAFFYSEASFSCQTMSSPMYNVYNFRSFFKRLEFVY